jgi:serine kinase of HPr protein (carbohydrate metabolism regulator)
MSKLIVHASAISLYLDHRWQGVLLSGVSGVGKSDLTLRALAAGFRLIADDYSLLWLSGPEGAQKLYARAPDSIAERMEIRGIGIVTQPARPMTCVDLVVHCQTEAIERMPEPLVTPILGHSLPTLKLDPREASAVVKLLSALRQIAG